MKNFLTYKTFNELLTFNFEDDLDQVSKWCISNFPSLVDTPLPVIIKELKKCQKDLQEICTSVVTIHKANDIETNEIKFEIDRVKYFLSCADDFNQKARIVFNKEQQRFVKHTDDRADISTVTRILRNKLARAILNENIERCDKCGVYFISKCADNSTCNNCRERR